MKIVFFISNIHLPRCVNRVNQFAENGYDVEAYYFDRTEFTNKVNALNVPTHCMGIMDSGSGSYFKRMPAQYKALRNVIKSYDKEMTIFYLFGFDMALIYYFTFSKAKYIFEESDLRHTYFKPIILAKLLEAIDKSIIKNSFLTVFTSEGFNKFHFGNKIANNIAFIPNKVSPEVKKYDFKVKHLLNLDHLQIGFVGAPRFKSVYNFIKVFCNNFPNATFHVFGEPCQEGIDEHKSLTNCVFHGPFASPQDLPYIYSQIDLVLSTYDAFIENVQYAEPNKIYESMYFEVPIIVSKGTFLAEKVESLGIGYAINPLNDNEIVNFIESLSESSINEKIINIKKIDKEDVLSTNKKFYKKLSSIL